jgi:hypothetical protein
MTLFYFKVDGRIEADSDSEATDKLYELLTSHVESFQILETNEIDDE